MTVFVEAGQFNQMKSFNPYANTKQEKKEVKFSLLDQIKDAIGDKWPRLKEGTRQAFDMVCFLGTELGFIFAGDEYLADRHDISSRTVRTRLKELEELGQVVKVHRRAQSCNGRGKPVYLFVHHPYFKYWMKLLNIKHDFHTDFQTENAGNACESKDEPAKNVPTYCLPEKNNNINHLNIKRSPYIKFVPKKLQHYQAFFGEQVKELYGRVWLAAKNLGVSAEQGKMQHIGFIAMDQLKRYIKSGKQLTEDQLCRLAYTISYNQLKDGEVKDNVKEQRKYTNKKPIRTEILPDWFDKEYIKRESTEDDEAKKKAIKEKLKAFRK